MLCEMSSSSSSSAEFEKAAMFFQGRPGGYTKDKRRRRAGKDQVCLSLLRLPGEKRTKGMDDAESVFSRLSVVTRLFPSERPLANAKVRVVVH